MGLVCLTESADLPGGQLHFGVHLHLQHRAVSVERAGVLGGSLHFLRNHDRVFDPADRGGHGQAGGSLFVGLRALCDVYFHFFFLLA